MLISNRVDSISASITLAINAKAKELKQKGMDVVGFGAGEPDFDTPRHIKEAAKSAIDEGFTKYTPSGGTKELKAAIRAKLRQDNGLEYSEDQILVSCGAKHSLFNVILALCQEGDEVILPSPFWVSYPEMIKASGAAPVIIETTESAGFKITVEQLQEAITAKTKLFILNSPSNPAGAVYSRQELSAIASILVKHDIVCISDEIYEKIIYGDIEHVSIACLGEDIKRLTVVINGVSKAYSMTGWRIGYAAGPAKLIKAMNNFQSHSTSNPTSISQKAAKAAIEGSQDCVDVMLKEFSKRREYMVEKLNSMEGITCLMPQGAFYVFPNIEFSLGKQSKTRTIKNSLDFCEALLEEEKVAAVPGKAFGKDWFIRLSYATSMENIKKGLERIENFITSLK